MNKSIICIYSYVFCMYISIHLYIYTYICTVVVVYGIYIIYIVFVRTLFFTFTSALLLINRSAISICPFHAAHMRAVCPNYIYIYIYTNIRTKTYDIDIVKEVSIHNTSYTIINI